MGNGPIYGGAAREPQLELWGEGLSGYKGPSLDPCGSHTATPAPAPAPGSLVIHQLTHPLRLLSLPTLVNLSPWLSPPFNEEQIETELSVREKDFTRSWLPIGSRIASIILNLAPGGKCGASSFDSCFDDRFSTRSIGRFCKLSKSRKVLRDNRYLFPSFFFSESKANMVCELSLMENKGQRIILLPSTAETEG